MARAHHLVIICFRPLKITDKNSYGYISIYIYAIIKKQARINKLPFFLNESRNWLLLSRSCSWPELKGVMDQRKKGSQFCTDSMSDYLS